MTWIKTMKFKNRVFVSLVILSVYATVLHIFEWDPDHIECFKYINDTRSHIYNTKGLQFIKFLKRENFNDLETYLRLPRDPKNPTAYQNVILRSLSYRKISTLSDMIGNSLNNDIIVLEKFQYAINRNYLYEENDPLVEKLLHEMATMDIIHIDDRIESRQIKLTITFVNGMKALFKPKRLPIDYETNDDHFFFQDIERHNSEIVAYHLDRALSFRRVMPSIGRRINMTTEFANNTSSALKTLFFWSPAPNYCFWINWTNCSLYCNIFDPICGEADSLEGSLSAYLPEFEGGEVLKLEYPWRRELSFVKKAEWESNANYCNSIKNNTQYSNDGYRKLLDIIDLSIFDFLLGNLDRQHVEYFSVWKNDSTLIHLDNGRGLGKPFYDDILILAPLTQCCVIRDSTLATMLQLHNGPKQLSKILFESLAADPIAPVLWEPHYIAMDRRIQIILGEIQRCLRKV